MSVGESVLGPAGKTLGLTERLRQILRAQEHSKAAKSCSTAAEFYFRDMAELNAATDILLQSTSVVGVHKQRHILSPLKPKLASRQFWRVENGKSWAM